MFNRLFFGLCGTWLVCFGFNGLSEELLGLLDCWRVSCWRVRCLEGELLEVRCEHCLSLFPSCSCKLEDTQVVGIVQSPVQ